MKQKRQALMGLVGGIGVVIAVAGFVGGYMSAGATITWAMGVWIIGATLVILFTDPPNKGD